MYVPTKYMQAPLFPISAPCLHYNKYRIGWITKSFMMWDECLW